MKDCVWNIDGTECSGDIHNKELFDDEMTVPICEAHYDAHCKLMEIYTKSAAILKTHLSYLKKEVKQKEETNE